MSRRLLTALEEAEQTPDRERRRHLQPVVAVGGGPSGCELAGSVNEMLRHSVAGDFKQLDPGDCKVTLVDPGERLLRAIASEQVTVATADGEHTLEAATICWTAGVRPSHLGRIPAERSGCPLDRSGRVIVNPDFSIPGHPTIRVVGDLCAYTHTSDGQPLPGMATQPPGSGGPISAAWP